MTEVLLAQADGRLEVRRGRGSFRPAGAAWLLLDREDSFAGPGWSALVDAGDRYELDEDISWTAVVRSGGSVASRDIRPEDVVIEHRGEGPTARVVRTYVAEGPLICGETLSPPGGWSSWPPHRHEHEEIYLYRFADPAGFGVQMVYDGDPGTPSVVRNGHIERIRGTYHPVVASPKSAMLYMWALAGVSMTLTPQSDPRYT
ncbi:MAG TPA: 5-deoxy-glucuronate isomerase [Acidimicrobiales bacterium]|nr:5-deoxy-glucuronate isomerase [Acidimicrobiales bacterium]